MVGSVPTWGGPSRRRFSATDLRSAMVVAALFFAVAAGWFNFRAWHEDRSVTRLRDQLAAAETAVSDERATIAQHLIALDAAVAALDASLDSYRPLTAGGVSEAAYAELQGPVRQHLQELRASLDAARADMIEVAAAAGRQDGTDASDQGASR